MKPSTNITSRLNHIGSYLLAGLLFAVYCLYLYSKCDSRMFLLTCIFFVPLLFGGHFILNMLGEKMRDLPAFVTASAVLGVVMCFVFPPLSVPDEFYHFQSSYWYSDVLMGSASLLDASEFPMRSQDLRMSQQHLGAMISNQSYRTILSEFDLFESDDSIDSVSDRSYTLGTNPPQLKIPSALGITIARVFEFGAYPLFYLGRLFNLVYYILLSALAIKIIPFGKKSLAAVALLPMTLHLAASYSYDAGILGLSFLFTALVIRSVFADKKMEKKEAISLLVVGVLLAPCKVIYSLIALFLLAIPSIRFSCRRDSLLFKLSIISAMVLAVLLLRISTLASMLGIGGNSIQQTHDGITGQYYTALSVLSNPIASALMFVRTLFEMGDFYWYSMVGGTLGAFQGSISAPKYFAIVLLGVLVFSSMRTSDDDKMFSSRQRILGSSIFLVGVSAIMLSLWVGWTFATENIIQGVQGRYFLPLLPLFLLSLRPSSCYVDLKGYPAVIKSLYISGLVYSLYVLAFGLATF